MFFRVKPAGSYRHLQIAHSVREGKKVRQQVIATLSPARLFATERPVGSARALGGAPLRGLGRLRCPCSRRDLTGGRAQARARLGLRPLVARERHPGGIGRAAPGAALRVSFYDELKDKLRTLVTQAEGLRHDLATRLVKRVASANDTFTIYGTVLVEPLI
jgi:hypothetical protein